MRQRLGYVCLLAILTIMSPVRASFAQVVGGIVSGDEAQRHGLTRAWYAQSELDGASDEVVDMTLNGGVLFVQTSRARLQALDAETGQTLWKVTVGHERYPCMTPFATANYVATVNGSTLYVIDRKTGREAWNMQLPGVPGSGPAISATHVFVPLVNGTIYGYDLKKPKGIPFRYKSFGRILVPPVMAADRLSWTTEQGYMYVMNLTDPDHLRVNFRLDTHDKIESRPGYWTPFLYAASLNGYVYAVHEQTGQVLWKYSTAEPIVDMPVAVDGKVYVCVEKGGMFCINGETGKDEWYSPNVTQFVSVSPTRVYGTDRLNRLMILDGKTGARLDSISISGVTKKLHNVQTDRLYLTTARGVVQCLHESDLTQPVTYTPPPLKQKEKPKTKQKKLPGAEDEAEKPADEPAAAEENPFGEGDDAAPKEDGEEKTEGEDANPFAS